MPASAELFKVVTPQTALAVLMATWRPAIRAESIATENALGRVLAEDVIAQEDLPAFRRSTMDGYAVIASDTHGASPALPALLNMIGEAPMGRAVAIDLHAGEAVLVHTGSLLPDHADAVVMVEHTSPSPLPSPGGRESIEVMRPVAAGENVLQVGEDVQRGATIYTAGHTIRPQDIGGLMALGVIEINVASKPRVGILSTGDEVIPPAQTPLPGQVRDVNSYALAAQAQQAGAQPIRYGIIPDDRTALEAAAQKALAECDIVVISAGSSVSARDMSVEVIGALGKPGVLVHGVSVKPGKPTIIAVCDGKAVFGLPGNPASAMVIFDLFVLPAIRACLGQRAPRPITVQAKLTRNIPSSTGREDIVPVNLEARDGELWATPVFGKSNLIYTLVRAEGHVKVDLDLNGIRAGETVDVYL